MAADEIRLILAHVLITYDVATEDHGPRPQNAFFKKILFPDMVSAIMLKRRKGEEEGRIDEGLERGLNKRR
jgi:hypothetical protein